MNYIIKKIKEFGYGNLRGKDLQKRQNHFKMVLCLQGFFAKKTQKSL